MRFYKEVWGIIWEFNSIKAYIDFTLGRVVGVIIFIGLMYLLVKCDPVEDLPPDDYKPIPAESAEFKEGRTGTILPN